jgi:hypothetical protein
VVGASRRLHPVQLADQRDTDPVAVPVHRLDHGGLAIADEHQVDLTVGRPAAADLPYTLVVAPERVGDDLLELLPAECREVAERALAAEPPGPDQ